MRPYDIFRSTGFKLAIACAGLFVLVSLATSTVAYLLIAKDLDGWLDRSISETTSYLLSEYREGGLAPLSESIEQHASAAEGDNEVYLLIDSSGHKIVGNVAKYSVIPNWHDAEPAEFGLTGTRTFRVLTRTVDSYTLIVARSDVEVDEIAAIIEQAFWVAAACTAAVALAGGLLLGWRAQRRVERFSTALDAVAHGNLDKRVRAKGRGGDDLDRIARDLNSTLDRLHSLVTSMKHVTVDIAHDLKSPIARLRNQLADALTKADGNAAAQVDISEAIGEADRISATFDSLLKIAQIESGERREHFVPFDLAERVRQVVDLYVPVAEDAGDVLMLEAEPPKPLPVHGDPSLVGQLLVNLIENSIRHSPGGTRIVVSARQTKQGAALSVADNGPGIAESEYDNVLKRFYRLDKSRGTRGSGLGLALVAAVTEVHDAELHLSSASPGLKVTVLFPSPTVLRPGATAAKKPGAQGWTATGAIAPR